MKFNKWTLGLAALGAVSLASAAKADEAQMSTIQTALSSTTISGYVDVAAIWRPGTDQGQTAFGANNPGNTPGYSFPAKNDGFYLNAIDIALDKPLDESPWSAGYHIELMAGPDSVGSGTAGGLVGIRQAYIALRTPVGNGIDWKIGVWDTIIGYESSSDPLNPNYTRSFGYAIEPTTHTGILGTYKINDMFSVSAGIADGSNVNGVAGINGTATYESQKAYMGSVSIGAPDSWGWAKGGMLTLGVINVTDSSGNFNPASVPAGVTGPGSVTSWYAGLTLPTPYSPVKVGAAFDYADFHQGGDIWTIGLYATYQATDKLAFNARGEYLNTSFGGGAAGDEITLTAQYNLWANVISRLEFRWDHAENGNAFGYTQGYIAGGAPNKSNDFMLALNLIYQF